MSTNDIQLCIGILAEYMTNCSDDRITHIPTSEVLRIKNMFQKFISESYVKDNQSCLDVVAIEESDRNDFEITADYWRQKGYEIIASSCNSKTWKAIMQRKDEYKENDK